jgi:hypothetical protein
VLNCVRPSGNDDLVEKKVKMSVRFQRLRLTGSELKTLSGEENAKNDFPGHKYEEFMNTE